MFDSVSQSHLFFSVSLGIHAHWRYGIRFWIRYVSAAHVSCPTICGGLYTVCVSLGSAIGGTFNLLVVLVPYILLGEYLYSFL